MTQPGIFRRNWRRVGGALLIFLLFFPTLRAESAPAQLSNLPIVLTVEGTNVWIRPSQSNTWESAYTGQLLRIKDQGRTGADSRTAIRLSDLSVLRVGWFSEFEIQPVTEGPAEAQFSLFQGLVRLLNRDRPGKHRFITPTATAATRGTEFILEVEAVTGLTRLTVFEGEAELSNALGSVTIGNGEQGIATSGQAPVKTAVIESSNLVQWCLYYPGVLDLDELRWSNQEQEDLATSLENYRAGDLLAALSAYPPGRVPASDAERIYLAALWLSVGQVSRSESVLEDLSAADPASRNQRLAAALRLVVDSVNHRPRRSTSAGESALPLATELLAESYFEQARFNLVQALALARRSAEISPRFAFARTRVAELEFSFGNVRRSSTELKTAIDLAPRNAQAFALQGFLFSAQNRIDRAFDCFEHAIALDGALGNAWLGRGLCRIRRGHAAAGRFDLHVAAALEPQRSILRSYLGKAFTSEADLHHAEQELQLAAEIDPQDPTPWLYSALLLRDQNRLNEAIRDLEHSVELNDHRRVYRSRLLLEQDRAVRGVNLATIYREAGLADVSVREAGRAVNADYANFSAHLFLANSYNALRGLNQINLRYETAWFSEYLVANLLAPVGAGTLAQSVSQHEYSKLFERDGLGFFSSSEYLSHGEWLQSAVQYGTFRNSSYALETFYHSDHGNRPNNDLEQWATVLSLKQQLGPQDSVYLRLNYYDSDYGDVNHYYDQRNANPGLRTAETYPPSLLAGFHREWSPGNHTLVLAGRLENEASVNNPSQGTLFFDRGFGSQINAVTPLFYNQAYRSELELYTAEVQQIWQRGDHTVVFGGRYQNGELDTRNAQFNGRLFDGLPIDVPITNTLSSSFQRGSLYLYDHWQIWPQLIIAGGLSYDWLKFPDNYRYAPLNHEQRRVGQVSPKIGAIWTPLPGTTVRAAWFRALGGVSLDQSVRLEPTQIAGFNQAYRSLISESVAGANAAPEFESWNISIEQRLWGGTFLALAGDVSSSQVDRTIGTVDFSAPDGPLSTSTPQKLDFRERSLSFTLNQLLGREWSAGVSYRISRAELADTFPEVPGTALLAGGFQPARNLDATLQQVRAALLYNHRSGFFARAGAIWTHQTNGGYAPVLPGDDFWQLNLETGYRFCQRRAELRLGLLNLFNQDYRLNPLNLTPDLPRERTLAMRFLFGF
jgi:Tfp pilus assembly protein PilF